MQLKRFEAVTLADALAQVREAFGPDALVLSTRTLRRGRAFGRLGRSVVEVTAAMDRDAARSPVPAPQRAPDASWGELRLTRTLLDPLESELRQLRGSVEHFEATGALALRDEVAQLRRLAADLRGPARASDDRAVGRLLAAGVAPRHAYALGEEAARGSGGADALVATLAARLDPQLLAAREDDPPVSVYVGPAGAGKTTTLAKVAARGGEPPALFTTDAKRLGADAALRSLAAELRAPFELALSPDQLAASVARRSTRRALVDTAGRSRGDAQAMGELRALRDALGVRAQWHLVLSATTKERDLAANLARYAPLAPDSLVITKVDDSQDLGNVVNLLLDPDTPPLAWIGDGQCVPEDLRVPDPHALAQQLLGAGS